MPFMKFCCSICKRGLVQSCTNSDRISPGTEIVQADTYAVIEVMKLDISEHRQVLVGGTKVSVC